MKISSPYKTLPLSVWKFKNAGLSSILIGNDNDNLALGLTSPYKTSAIALPNSLPPYQA